MVLSWAQFVREKIRTKNPAPFSWVPIKNQYYKFYDRWVPRGNFSYRLEITKDASFKSNVISSLFADVLQSPGQNQRKSIGTLF